MKPNSLFAASSLKPPQKPLRLICIAVMLLTLPVGSVNSQSKDRDNPTILTSNVISGMISPDNNKDNYHYSFVAGPGEIAITVTLESAGKVNQIVLDLFDEDAKRIAATFVTASGGRSEQVVERVNITRRQPVLLRIILQNNFGPGKYRVRIGGAVKFGQDSPSSGIDPIAAFSRDTSDNPECLPKKGILRVKMKDGSVRRIDLSEAEEITIEH